MNRFTTILKTSMIVKSLLSSQLSRECCSLPFQVSTLSHSSHSLHRRISTVSTVLSSKQNSFIDDILINDWSKDLEQKLSSLAIPSHESVIYILKKLDKDPNKAGKFINWIFETNRFKPSSAVYGLVLRILANKETMTQFWATVNKMKELGFSIDEPTYLTIRGYFCKSKMSPDITAWTELFKRMTKENQLEDEVMKVVKLALENDWGKLTAIGAPLSEDFVLKVLKELRDSPLKALKFFKWAGTGSGNGYEHSSVAYNAILRVLGRTDSIWEFWSMVEEMKSVGHFDMDIDTYIKLSRRFEERKMSKDAVELYEHMMDGPYKPSTKDCGKLLRSISSNSDSDLDLVFRVVKKYEETGHSLTKIEYDGIHRSLTRIGRFEEANKIVESMRNAGFEPDNITYSQLVFGLCKAKRLDDAVQVLEEMQGNGIIPDLKTWTVLIQGHCDVNEIDKALLCFANMMEKGCDADSDLLDVLINGFLYRNRIDGAYTLLVEMVQKARLRPWQATYKTLIGKLLEERKLEQAIKLSKLMKKQNYPSFPDPFVRYISKFGTVQDADDFLKSLSGKEYPSISAYLHVFESFFKEGRYSEGEDLLFMCPVHVRKHVAVTTLFGSSSSKKSNT
ncbi:pentatricopeptide repeat-containing protein At3g48250, chloroplastic [Impatiens glandulifera]|uniref:pentatricopeptide repeat-containing protein At3g48250, chloroplastic n=1 Tax=Impatiens glandulifera TaxID=253017 RepID=UPI001FB14B12|nr:pentatricopeptide repeat-containing protein At3g48250, chloroplastic [Impatiens glandulifera]